MIRLAVFDCDGTLVDSQANICQAMEEAFALARIEPPPRAAIRRTVGLSLVEIMRTLLPDADDDLRAALVQDYRAAFFRLREAGAMAHEPLFEGMIDVLDRLADTGWTLGVATGKSDRGLNHILAYHGIAHRFVTLQTADRHPSEPHPAMIEQCMADAGAVPGTTVMIGDTSYDIIMAIAAGTRAVGVGWGYHDADELMAAGAHVIVDAVPDLPRYLDAA